MKITAGYYCTYRAAITVRFKNNKILIHGDDIFKKQTN